LFIDPEYEKLLPPLPAQEREAMKESLLTEGQHHPVDINKKKIILDGHNRAILLTELGKKIKRVVKDFPDKLTERKFVIESNLKRRHLNDFQRAELLIPLLEIEQALAKKRRLSKLKNTKVTLAPNESNDKGKALEILARKHGISATTLMRAKTVIEKGSEELKDKVRKDKTSIHFAYKTLTRNKNNKPKPLPKGEYDIILSDVPIEYRNNLEGSPDAHYDVLSVDKLKAMKVPSAKDSMLFFWATYPTLEDALKIIHAWGFEYKSQIVWIKAKDGKLDPDSIQIGTGYYVRGSHELLLICKKGSVPLPFEEDRPSSVFIAERTKHSKKPPGIYNVIEKMYPNRNYLELFARSKRKGWTSYGDQV
jgi:N6-adenosine-specific RNA methylase IME4